MNVVVLCLALLSLVHSIDGTGDLSLHMVSNDTKAKFDAACLDGTTPAYWMKAASDASTADKWVLYLHGGGWCYDEAQCVHRTHTSLGTSNNLPAQNGFADGAVSDSPSNPFQSWNRVLFHYCDGASFSGLRDGPVDYNGTMLYFRGRANLDAILLELRRNHGFDSATEVVLSGGSAGGLATFLHADYIRSVLPAGVQKYGAIPASGFFLNHTNAAGTPVYPDQMQYVYSMQQSQNGVNKECVAAKAPTGTDFECILAQNSYAFIRSNIFVINSVVDLWQAQCILTSEPVDKSSPTASCASLPGWRDCVKSAQLSGCNSSQIADVVNPYGASFLSIINSTSTFHRAGNGAFLSSCFSHVASQGSGFSRYSIRGVVMVDAISQWWNSFGPASVEPAATHTYLPCTLHADQPHECNPSCGATMW